MDLGTIRMNFHIAAIFSAILFLTASETNASSHPRSPADAVKAAACVREVIKKADSEFSPIKSEEKITQADRDRISQHLEKIRSNKTLGIKKCLTKEEVYQLGWFEFLDTTAILRCTLHRTEALKKHTDEDGNDTGLLNGAVRWEAVTKDFLKHPFFRGEKDARDNYRSSSQTRICEELMRDFGPKGYRFPGLVY